MAVPYAKDDRGVVSINCEGAVFARPTGGPDNAADRNHSGRVFLADGVPYEAIVRAGGREYEVAGGVASAKAGLVCGVYVRVRGEADQPKPPDPAEGGP